MQLSWGAESQPCPTCARTSTQGIEVSGLKHVQDVLGQQCPNEDEFRNEATRQYEKLFPKKSKQAHSSEPIHGIRLSGRRDELEIAEQILGSRPPSQWPAIAKGCDDVRCAITRLFGSEEAALRVLNIAQRSGYLMSASQEINPSGKEQLWSLAEIRSVDRAIQQLPDKFLHLATLKNIFRAANGVKHKQHPDNPAMAASDYWSWLRHYPGSITMYDNLFPQSDLLSQLITHEFSHHLDFTWLEKTGEYAHQAFGFSAINQFVTEYAKKTPQEDFAESVSYAIYFPEKMRIEAPAKLELVTKLFDGKLPSSWPTLDSLLKQKGGIPGLLAACLGELTAIGSPAGQDVTFVYERRRDLPGQTIQYYPSSFSRQTQCLKPLLKDLAPELAKTDDFCLRGGMAAAELEVKRRVEPYLKSLINVASNFWSDFKAGSITPCPGETNFSEKCFYDRVFKPEAKEDPALKTLGPDLEKQSQRIYQLLFRK